MCEFIVKIAGYTILIRAMHSEVKTMFNDYLTEESPQIIIESSESGILAERQLMKRDKDLCPYVDRFSDGRVEESYLHRLIAESFSKYGVILMHGSAIALDGEAYIFVAPSGTGKSTHARLWREAFGDRTEMINDDKPLLKCTDGGIFVCGSPWNGKHHLGANISVPLKAICFLKRGLENHIEKISSEEAFFIMLEAVYHSNNVQNEDCILKSLQSIRQSASFYRLQCNMNSDAAEVSYNGMRSDKERKKMSFEELLERDGYLAYTNVGISMMPLLRQGKDVIKIRKKGPARCQKYDAVLYKVKDKYILHRIIKVRENDYVIVGDNCFRKEYGITDRQILGVLTSIVRNGKEISVSDKKYLLYVHLWCDLYPVRAGILYIRNLLGRVKSKILN